MTKTAIDYRLDGERLQQGLQEIQSKLDSRNTELTLDFSAVCRLDPGALHEMEILATTAQRNDVKVGLRGVNVDVYKVLKLVKLAPYFFFSTEP